MQLTPIDRVDCAVALYVCAQNSASVSLPAGTYRLRFAMGEDWHTERKAFQRRVEYSAADKVMDLSHQSIELHLQESTSGDVRTARTDPIQF